LANNLQTDFAASYICASLNSKSAWKCEVFRIFTHRAVNQQNKPIRHKFCRDRYIIDID